MLFFSSHHNLFFLLTYLQGTVDLHKDDLNCMLSLPLPSLSSLFPTSALPLIPYLIQFYLWTHLKLIGSACRTKMNFEKHLTEQEETEGRYISSLKLHLSYLSLPLASISLFSLCWSLVLILFAVKYENMTPRYASFTTLELYFATLYPISCLASSRPPYSMPS